MLKRNCKSNCVEPARPVNIRKTEKRFNRKLEKIQSTWERQREQNTKTMLGAKIIVRKPSIRAS